MSDKMTPFKIYEGVVTDTTFLYDVDVDDSYIYMCQAQALEYGIVIYSYSKTGDMLTYTEKLRDGSNVLYFSLTKAPSYLYAIKHTALFDNYLMAFTWDGTTLTNVGSVLINNVDTNLFSCVNDGTYVYLLVVNNLFKYSFNGTTFTQEATVAIDASYTQKIAIYNGNICAAGWKSGGGAFRNRYLDIYDTALSLQYRYLSTDNGTQFNTLCCNENGIFIQGGDKSSAGLHYVYAFDYTASEITNTSFLSSDAYDIECLDDVIVVRGACTRIFRYSSGVLTADYTGVSNFDSGVLGQTSAYFSMAMRKVNQSIISYNVGIDAFSVIGIGYSPIGRTDNVIWIPQV